MGHLADCPLPHPAGTPRWGSSRLDATLATPTRLLAGLTVAGLDDPTTWTDLDAALP